MGFEIPWPMYFAAGTLLSLVAIAIGTFRSRAADRVAEFSKSEAQFRAAKMSASQGTLEARLERRVASDKRKADIRDRLVQAGFYSRRASVTFLTIRLLSMCVPLAVALILSHFGWMSTTSAVYLGLTLGIAGIIGPSFILDFKKRARQTRIQRALPDALDILNICLGGGISLSGSISRVSQELSSAHPDLALELAIVDRETRMGRTVAESLRSFADRFDLSELRSLASVIAQAERYGASVTQALEVYAETMRLKRSQHAEERAQKAVIKVIFPTLFCIFPALFVVVLGPAVISIYQAFIVD